MEEVLFFSSNKNKIKEVDNFFKNSKINILNLNNFPKIIIPKEIGSSFRQNAEIKSKYGLVNLNVPCFADDSGICINALNNFPGIKSKRYIKENGGYKKTFKKIIQATKKLMNTNAYFQTIISLNLKKNSTFFFEGKIKGNISEQPRGVNGFGYDPIFIPNGYDKTFGEMSQEEKNMISHRGIAILKLQKFLLK